MISRRVQQLEDENKWIADNLSMKITCTYVAAFEDTDNGRWEHDLWSVELYNLKTHKTMTLKYHTGVGHRVLKGVIPMAYRNNQRLKDRYIKEHAKPVTPMPLNILYSVCTDIEAASYNLLDFCEEFGYDADSIKHNKIYNDCCVQAREFKKIFPQINLSDYEQITER